MIMPSSIRSANKAIPAPNPGQAVVSLSAVANQAQLHDRYIRGVFPTDALEDQVRQEWRDRRAQRDPFLSQEFVESVNLGRGMDAEKWRDRRARQDRLRQQTELLAAALERTGISARRNADVMAIDVMTGAQELLSAYRSICFLPEVAQRDRRPMLNALIVFRRMHRNHGKFMRYAVVTGGPSIPLLGLSHAKQSSAELETGEDFSLRDRISELSRSVSRFAQWANQVHDVDVVFRGIEFTVKRRDGDNFLSVHPHANVLYTPRRLMKKNEWDKFLAGASAQFHGYWWKDCGKLEHANEAIKYPFKPSELDPQRIGDAGVRWLFDQTFGLPMTQPLGAFRAWCNDTFWTVEVGADGKPRRRQHRKAGLVDYPSGARLDVISMRKRIGKRRDPHKIVRDDQLPMENLLLGYTMPQRRFSPWASPVALVMNYTPHPGTELGQEALDDIEARRRRLLPNWQMNGAPDPAIVLAVGRGQAAALEGDAGDVVPFSVHTCSSTAGSGSSRGPPTVVRATAVDEWQQLGVDFSVGMNVFEDVMTGTAGTAG